MSISVAASVVPNWLDAFPRLAAITDPIWRMAQGAARTTSFPAGTTLMRPGTLNQNQGFVLIAEGTVHVSLKAENGREIALYRTHAGELCVLSLAYNLFNKADYLAEAVVEEDATLVNISREDFQSTLTQSAAFREVIFSTVVQRLRDLIFLVGQVTFERLDLRLACLLGQLFGKNDSVSLPVTHQELAAELGTSREVVSRLLKEFELAGCIRLHRGSIELVSYNGLAQLSSLAIV